MAQGTIVVLVTFTSHPGQVSSSQSLTGNKQPAGAFYLAARDLQTIVWNLEKNDQNPNPPNGGSTVSPTTNFSGTIHIEASLVKDPQDSTSTTPSDWFKVYEIPTSTEVNGYYNLPGNYVWLRAKVTNWTQGVIYQITASY